MRRSYDMMKNRNAGETENLIRTAAEMGTATIAMSHHQIHHIIHHKTIITIIIINHLITITATTLINNCNIITIAKILMDHPLQTVMVVGNELFRITLRITLKHCRVLVNSGRTVINHTMIILSSIEIVRQVVATQITTSKAIKILAAHLMNLRSSN